MYPDLARKTAIVTGASKGIGEAIALRFGSEKMNVALNYFRDSEQAERIVKEIRSAGGDAFAMKADVSREEDVRRLIDAAVNRFGDIHVMVNNAGIQTTQASHELSLEEWNRVIGVNLTGVFICCREVLRHMLRHGIQGSVLNISSVHERMPKPLHVHYASSKGALKMLTKTLALEYAREGIRVNAIAPGAIRTPMNSEILRDADQVEQVLSLIPIGRIGMPDEIAAAAAWLASEQSSYVTGTTLMADGGMTLGIG